MIEFIFPISPIARTAMKTSNPNIILKRVSDIFLNFNTPAPIAGS